MFGGKRQFNSVKAKLDCLLKIYKYITAYEDHTGGGGDGDVEGRTDEERITAKLKNVKAAGIDMGTVKAADIKVWMDRQWYEIINQW